MSTVSEEWLGLKEESDFKVVAIGTDKTNTACYGKL